jgi:F-type H+-transporting ATPase subunit delta
MNDSKIPVRYSKAMFEFALEKDKLDKVYEDMGVIHRIVTMKEVRNVMDNPVLTSSKRREILGALLYKDIDALTLRFLDLVFSEGREKYLESMTRDFIDMTRRHRGISEVTITTTSPVSEVVRKEVIDLIEKKMKSKVELIEKYDADLIGGFILRVDDTYIDASVRNRINRFKKEFGASF